MMKAKKTFDELNFGVEAQRHFDALCENEDWTWTGIAQAFSRRYNDVDFSELKSAIDHEYMEKIR
jgi:hypothetical protein